MSLCHTLLFTCHSLMESHTFDFTRPAKVQQEAQAVNRVHRIGQTRPTFVHKYVVDGTVEKRIHSMTEAIFENTKGGVRTILLFA